MGNPKIQKIGQVEILGQAGASDSQADIAYERTRVEKSGIFFKTDEGAGDFKSAPIAVKITGVDTAGNKIERTGTMKISGYVEAPVTHPLDGAYTRSFIVNGIEMISSNGNPIAITLEDKLKLNTHFAQGISISGRDVPEYYVNPAKNRDALAALVKQTMEKQPGLHLTDEKTETVGKSRATDLHEVLKGETPLLNVGVLPNYSHTANGDKTPNAVVATNQSAITDLTR